MEQTNKQAHKGSKEGWKEDIRGRGKVGEQIYRWRRNIKSTQEGKPRKEDFFLDFMMPFIYHAHHPTMTP